MEYVFTSDLSIILDALYFFQSFYDIDRTMAFIEKMPPVVLRF